ncbi:2OG-Fe(II) oxygenase [Metabacillus sp. KIGAM252]|uniref:2OG-Fe(II) oxygenase n=1 Tax=Metabacillus flavus TaxID=2823519 RepID=A0ABS5LKH6_9BACI|nr:2OG-Fe(II) oxygenase [Metabacillus flavus]MBS2971048.1 2OG-Fe(II) oxygenase [Metabacillus flavus]
MAMQIKEQSIFNHGGNKIVTEDRDISIIAKLEEPMIAILGNVLSHEECDELIQLSKEHMNRSKIGTEREVSGIRTSSGTFLPETEHGVTSRIERRVAQITNVPASHGEGLHILNYKPGEEYKAHLDYFKSSKANHNPRISTLIMYLNDVEEGGETYFPHLKLSITPQKGMAVYFEYFYQDPAINELTLHGGAPVISGDKWAATMWVRRRQYR